MSGEKIVFSLLSLSVLATLSPAAGKRFFCSSIYTWVFLKIRVFQNINKKFWRSFEPEFLRFKPIKITELVIEL